MFFNTMSTSSVVVQTMYAVVMRISTGSCKDRLSCSFMLERTYGLVFNQVLLLHPMKIHGGVGSSSTVLSIPCTSAQTRTSFVRTVNNCTIPPEPTKQAAFTPPKPPTTWLILSRLITQFGSSNVYTYAELFCIRWCGICKELCVITCWRSYLFVRWIHTSWSYTF